MSIQSTLNTYYRWRHPLPDFLIIGVQKGGTKFLCDTLATHPHITMVRLKNPAKRREIHFFDKEENWERGINWYRSHFRNDKTIWGEKTPEYIYYQPCHRRMYETMPETKLLLLLRNPVKRAYSQWKMDHVRVKNGKKGKWINQAARFPFAEALKKTGEFLERGIYIEQIESLLSFYQQEQALILISERFWNNSQQTLQAICQFLQVPARTFTITAPKKKRRFIKPMEENTRKWLYEFYRPYNDRLFEFLGEEIQEWNEQGEN
ncbi:MAG: sulfotransferase domain-containing protein [bacterium]|nr:sulfotransferase domain-containing protein [bacterium]